MFRTELSLRPAAQLLSQGARVLTIGSCFSDVIGGRLAGHKVRTLVNPFGTVFNPLAAARLLRAAAGEDTDWQQHLVEARGRWQSYDLHATIGADSPPALLERIEQAVRETAEFARRADVLVWTLGTAYGYRLRDTGEVVNNCHKVPAERFEKELLTAEEIVSAVTEAYALLRQQNPKLQLVLTVSPVRHLKDTLPLNAVSKSVLRVACHYLSELLPGASYFPAYELLLDDLRDYRFYASDMIHPSEVAEQYVWEKFTQVYFDANFKQFAQEWEGIQRSLNHRPLHDGAPEHREFLLQTQKRLQRLLSRHVDVRLELLDVQDRLDALPAPPTQAQAEEPDDNEERIDIGYEDATVPVAPKTESEVAPVRVKAEPTWAEILAEEEKAEAEDAEEAEELATGPINEAEAALPAEAGAGKRRKRKRGGRKHKKKGNRPAEGEAVASEGDENAPELSVTDSAAAEFVADDSPAAPVLAPELSASTPPEADATVIEPALPNVEAPVAEAAVPTSSKRRKRPNRKKPALYAEPAEPTAEDNAGELIAAPIEAAPEQAVDTEPVQPPIDAEPSAAEPQPVADAADTAEPDSPAAAEPAAPSRRKPRSSRKAKPAAQAVDAAADVPPVPAVTATPAVLPAAEPAPATLEPEAADAAQPATPAAPRRRAAPRRKPAPTPAEQPAPVESAPAAEPTPASDEAAAPKKRSRPPRRKPQDPAADNS